MAKVVHLLEVSSGPTHQIANDVLEFCREIGEVDYVAGDKLSVGSLMHPSLNFIEAVVLPSTEEDEEVFGYYATRISLTVHLLDKNVEMIKETLDSWVAGEKLGFTFVNHEIIESLPSYHVIKAIFVSADPYNDLQSKFGGLIDSKFQECVWDKHMNKIITEGVCYVYNKVPSSLCDSLRKHINNLASNTDVDYHPNSNEIVRDLVHPALYSYIKGVSVLNSKSHSQTTNVIGSLDFWGRSYEDSKFQWLPTPFCITNEGKCIINEYINNLSRDNFPNLYSDIEKLFEVFLPYFEDVWAYARAIKLYKGGDNDGNDYDVGKDNFAHVNFEKENISFKGSELQVIVKIVDYVLKPEQTYEGVWHAEGMSHENIVMTGIYFIDRDVDITGGDLRFKRAMTEAEREHIFWSISQNRPIAINDFAAAGFTPLGKFPTEEGYLLVFPNSHIHKISKFINTAKNKSSSRRIIVFFVVNPETKIISTRDVSPQQGLITLRKAKSYRLELMSERKYDKDGWNVRDIELCEH